MARVRQSRLILPVALALCILSLYLLTASSDLRHNGDTDLRYQTTQAIVDHGRLWIDQPMWLDTRVAKGVGGHLYAFYGPGQAVLMIPLYVAGKVVAHHLNLPYDITTLYAARSVDLFLGALLALVFFFFAVMVGYSRRTATILTLVFAFATAAWPDAQSALEQTPVNLFLLAGSVGFWMWMQSRMRSARGMLVLGTGVGAALCTRYDAAIYVAIFSGLIAGYTWWDRRTREAVRALLVFGASLAPWVVAVLAWNYARFGSPFVTGLHERTFGGDPISNVLSLTVSPGKGLLWYVPVVILLPWAIRGFVRRTGRGALFFAVMAVAPVVFYSNVLFWHGDPAWGPRYLYIALPYLVLPLGEILESWGTRRVSLRAAAFVLAAFSLAIQVAAVSVTQWRFWYHLEVDQQRMTNGGLWAGQPFRWGAAHYHYYWNVAQSPILVQFRDVYEVARVALGDESYRQVVKPDPWIGTNTADNYPVNSAAFWWSDALHPLFGPRTRAALALILALLALISMAAMAFSRGVRARAPSVTVAARKVGSFP